MTMIYILFIFIILHMEFVRLVDYIKEWELFEKVDWEYEQIVSDYDFLDFDLWNFVRLKRISDIKKVDISKKTLFILDILLFDNIFDVLWKIDNFAVIDMNFGITWYGKKIWHTKKIVRELLDLWIEIYEPYDLLSFLMELCWNDWKKYFRVTNLDLPENISNWEKRSHISLDWYWFNWWEFSIITTWSMLAEVVRFWNLLKENWLNSEIIVLNKLHDFDNEVFWDKNFVFIVDWKSLGYESFVKDSFWSNLKVIVPKYENVSTILDEYILESAWFDAESLFGEFF